MADSNLAIIQGYVPGMIGDITRLHVDYYLPQWNMGLDLEAAVAQDVAAFMQRYDERRDGIWSISQQQRIAGAIIIDGFGEPHDQARLRYFIVSDSLRGQGMGRRLMQTALDFCDARGLKRVYLKTFTGLDAAIHLYEAFGFVVYNEYKHEGIKDLYFERLR
jgi:ribosomal protein S18 acetylase RimI-like enzyme